MNDTKPADRPSAHPGEYLRRDFMPREGLTVAGLAEAMGGADRSKIERLVMEEEPVTPDIAEALARVFDTSPELWIGLQKAHDLSVLILSERRENQNRDGGD